MRPLFVLALLALVAGCKDVRVTDNRDGTFLHEATELANTGTPLTEASLAATPLFPTTIGSSWIMKSAQGEEEVRLVQTRAVGGTTGYVFQMTRQGRVYRDEIYTVDSKGTVSQISAGGDQKVVLNPPLPVVVMPLEQEKITEWQGTATFQDVPLPARAWSRLRGIETITAGEKTYNNAYRFESVLRVTVNGKQEIFPTTRWLVPGIGIVRTTFRIHVPTESGGEWREFTKDLVRYKKP